VGRIPLPLFTLHPSFLVLFLIIAGRLGGALWCWLALCEV
jgi:hypothetical protein